MSTLPSSSRSDQPMNFSTTQLPEFIRIPSNLQKTITFIITFLIIFPNSTLSQSSFSSANDENYSPNSVSKLEPSLAIVVGVLSILFSLTLLTLIYLKCCHISSSTQENFGRTRSRFSGIDKNIIESLPYFKFSTLKGWKKGLECSVCLSAFEDIELLRLLPKCKHGFHIDCIDQWLQNHSSCPLCRIKVIEDDIYLFMHSNSSNESEPSSNIGLFIAREGSSRVIEKDQDEDQDVVLHKFNHRIMIYDGNDHPAPVMLKTRWSNVSSSDILFLKAELEMITCTSSNRFDHLEIEGHHRRIEEPRRSVSEITVHPRFLEAQLRDVDEQNLRRLWLPIARRTVERFANNENRYVPDGQPLQIQNSRELLDV